MTYDSLMCLVVFQVLMVPLMWEGTGYLDSTEIHKNPVTHDTSHPCDTQSSEGAVLGIATWMR